MTRYFDTFKTQDSLYQANLPPDFFYLWHEKYKDTWHESSASCTRHLICHKDCPEDLRDLYINSSRVELRRAALLTRASMSYVEKNIELILKDRAKSMQYTYAQVYLIPWFFGKENCDEITYSRLWDSTYEKISIFMSPEEAQKNKESYHHIVIDRSRLRVLSEIKLEILKRSTHPRIYSIIDSLNSFAINPVMGLLVEDPKVRRLAENYFRDQNDK